MHPVLMNNPCMMTILGGTLDHVDTLFSYSSIHPYSVLTCNTTIKIARYSFRKKIIKFLRI